MIEAPFNYQFRLILIGDSTVGKSTLLKVFTEGSTEAFTDAIDPTVGVDFFAKSIQLKNGTTIKLQLWDTAGQEKFRSITRSYYRNSVGALLLYDVTRRSSFEHLVDWLFEVRRHIEPTKAVYQVVACKVDMEEDRVIPTEEGQAFADFHNINFIETSARTIQNVEKAFRMIAEEIYEKVKSGEFQCDEGWEGIKVGQFTTSTLSLSNLNGTGFSRVLTDPTANTSSSNDVDSGRGQNKSKCC